MNRKNEIGFTLLELMMAVSIATVMLGAMYYAFQMGDRQIQTADVRMTIQDSSREGLYQILQELRQSAPDRVTIGAGGNTLQFDIPNSANPINTNPADAVQDYSVDWANGQTVLYSLNANQQLIRTIVGTGQTRTVANDVASINFTGNSGNPTLVTITLNVQRSLINGQAIPATPLQIVGQAEIRNS